MKKAFHPCFGIALLSLVIICGVFLIRITGHTDFQSEAPTVSASTGASIRKIDINTADNTALEQIPGIGPSIASSIIAYRDANGLFTDPSQLLEIPGIGEQKLITLMEYVYWEE